MRLYEKMSCICDGNPKEESHCVTCIVVHCASGVVNKKGYIALSGAEVDVAVVESGDDMIVDIEEIVDGGGLHMILDG